MKEVAVAQHLRFFSLVKEHSVFVNDRKEARRASAGVVGRVS